MMKDKEELSGGTVDWPPKPKILDYQLGWAVLAARRLLDTLKQNFEFSQPTLLHNIKGSYHTVIVLGSSTLFFFDERILSSFLLN